MRWRQFRFGGQRESSVRRALHRRQLQLESLESRQMLSVTPIGDDTVHSDSPESALLAAGVMDAMTQVAAPEFFVATTQTDPARSVLLWWSPVTGADEYMLEYRTDSMAEWAQLGRTFTDGTAFLHVNLRPDTAYHYRITALSDGVSSSPAMAETRTLPEPPDMPYAPRIVETTANSVRLDWDSVDRTDHYILEYAVGETDGGSGGSAPQDADYRRINAEFYGTTCTQTGLTPDTVYWYRIVAVNGTGESRPGAAVSTRTLRLPPASPTGLTATAENATTIRITWNSADRAGSYHLEWTTAEMSGWAVLGDSIPATQNGFLHTGLDFDTTYSYRIVAVNESGTSATTTASAKTPMSAPATPVNFVAEATGTDALRLTWDSVRGAIGYLFEWSPNGVTSWTAIGETLTTTSYTHTRLMEGEAYYYRVVAINTAGRSGYASCSGTTWSASVASPTGFQVALASESQIRLRWDTAGSGTVFMLESSPNEIHWTPLANELTATSFVHTWLSWNTTYYYRLTAIQNGRVSQPVILQTKTIGYTIPAPTGPAATEYGVSDPGTGLPHRNVEVSWTAAPGIGGYRVEYSTSGEDESWVSLTGAGNDSTTATSIIHHDAQPDTLYYYRICAVDGAGTSGYVTTSLRTTATPATPTGVKATASTESEIVIFWNIVTGETRYVVEWTTGGGGGTTVWTQLGSVTETSITHCGLKPETTYWYRVMAVDNRGCSATVECSATTLKRPPDPPVTPTGFTGVAIPIESEPGEGETATASIQLSWNHSDDATTYLIFESADNGKSWAQVATTTDRTILRTGLTPDSMYFYRLVAIGEGGASNPAVAQTRTATVPIPPTPPVPVVPATPSDLTARVTAAKTVVLRWTTVADATEYRLESSKDGKTWNILATAPGGQSNGGSIGEYEIKYSTAPMVYRIVAINSPNVAGGPGGVWGTQSAPSAAVGITPQTSIVNGLSATATQVQIRWANALAADAYTVYRSVNGAEYEIVTTVTATSFTDKAIAAGNQYQYRIVSLNRKGAALAGQLAESEAAESGSIVVPLAAPASVKVVATGEGVVISWNADAASQNAAMSSGSGFRYVLTRTLDDRTVEIPLTIAQLTPVYNTRGIQTGWTYTDTGSDIADGMGDADENRLPDNTKIVYNLRSETLFGESAPLRAALSVTTAPGAPTELAIAVVGEKSVTLGWTAPNGGAPGYQILRLEYNADGTPVQRSGQPVWNSLRTVAGSAGSVTLSYVDTSIKNAVRYEYRIVSYDPKTRTASSPTATVAVLTTPAKPASLKANTKLLTPTSVTLSWTVPVVADGTYIFLLMRSDGGAFEEIGGIACSYSVSGKNLLVTATDFGLHAGTAYQYTLREALVDEWSGGTGDEIDKLVWSPLSTTLRVKTPVK